MSAAPATDPFDEQGAGDGEGKAEGKLFELPRVELDESNPTVLKVAVSGHIEIDRSQESDVDFYNSLAAGKRKDLQLEVHVGGSKKTHRRDAEGNVDAIVETKSIIVTGVTVEKSKGT